MKGDTGQHVLKEMQADLQNITLPATSGSRSAPSAEAAAQETLGNDFTPKLT